MDFSTLVNSEAKNTRCMILALLDQIDLELTRLEQWKTTDSFDSSTAKQRIEYLTTLKQSIQSH